MLAHVYWLGGGPGAGKSTIARRLATDHGLRLYDTDRAMPDHARRGTPEDSPELARFAAMDMTSAGSTVRRRRCWTPSTGSAAKAFR
jgi:adenylate kinase family enzyme